MTDHAIEAASRQVETTLSKGRSPRVETFFDEATFTASYVVFDPESRSGAIIDSVLDYDSASGRTSRASADRIVGFVEENGLTVEWILETHAHADHLSAAPYLQEKLGGKIAIGRHITTVQETFGKLFGLDDEFKRDGSQFDHLFDDRDTFTIGGLPAIALHVPGHTPADIAYVIGDAAFPGDTIFMPDFGTARADFPGGDARQLYRSIQRLFGLPDETRLFLCHDYKAPGRSDYVWETTIGRQREANVHLMNGVTEDEFVAMREARDSELDMPRLILPSIQVNIRAGRFPEPSENGVRYLKIPIDAV